MLIIVYIDLVYDSNKYKVNKRRLHMKTINQVTNHLISILPEVATIQCVKKK